MGDTAWVLLGVVVVLVVVAALLLQQASRVDRLHKTVLRSRATLETQLFRRAAAAQELAASGALEPAEALVVADAALRAIDAASAPLVGDHLEGPAVADLDEDRPGPDRRLVESELSRTLREVLGDSAERAALAADPRSAQPLADLERACYRLQLARRFHNTHVGEARRVRANPVVRLFHLAGRAPLPEPVDLDDAVA
ncbi:hypothetical protein MF406_09650 [Georgenia sp. TF02-10]|uniref:hypothetical protein n=1 Tax=Georgenia sp. TF02-10 TaxID=2917725 RepID=UPI001FA7EC26|nr:hypothetical protein [Georgenia sp. TF02-10]UNX53290.1 hypothetical protein MF406_09650 [Georgenia sp. TF02-10]